MQAINLAVGYLDIPNFHALNLSFTDQLTDAEYGTPAPFQGLEGFREAIAAKLQIANGIQYLTPENILVTQGATQALYLIVEKMLNAGDEVVLPLPAWGYFSDLLKAKKVALKTPLTQREHQYKITATELDAVLSEETKMLIWTNPGNPGGGIYTHSEMIDIVQVLRKYPNLLILSDEIYELLNFSDNDFYPLSFFPSIAEQVITVNGFSKSFGLTSWRIAYLYSHNADYISRLTDLQKMMTYGLPVATQRIAWTALQKEKLYGLIWQQHGKDRRQTLYDFLKKEANIDVYLPDGAYFLFPDMTDLCEKAGFKKSAELPAYLKNRYNLHIADGEVFGLPFHYRINFAQSEGTLQEAINRMRKAFAELRKGLT